MKLLVIDDNRHAAKKIAAVVAEFGEVVVCTTDDSLFGKMPAKDVVVNAITLADLVLLDGQICREYSGKDLLPHCAGKKVLGISTQFNLGEGENNWYSKDALSDGKQYAIDSLREKVAKMVSVS